MRQQRLQLKQATTTEITTSDVKVATSSKLTSTTVTEGEIKTVTTIYVESTKTELEKAKADAMKETVTEEAEKSNHLSQQQKQIIKLKQLKSTQSLKTTKGQS